VFLSPQGGETQALARMELYLANAKWVCAFEKPQTDPSAFEKPATTVLSPYLKVTVAGACVQNYYC